MNANYVFDNSAIRNTLAKFTKGPHTSKLRQMNPILNAQTTQR